MKFAMSAKRNKTANGQTKGHNPILKSLHRQHPSEISSKLLNEQHATLKTLQYFLTNNTQFLNALKGQSPTQKSLKRTKMQYRALQKGQKDYTRL